MRVKNTIETILEQRSLFGGQVQPLLNTFSRVNTRDEPRVVRSRKPLRTILLERYEIPYLFFHRDVDNSINKNAFWYLFE